jgi:AraC-like DNA-binding protein
MQPCVIPDSMYLCLGFSKPGRLRLCMAETTTAGFSTLAGFLLPIAKALRLYGADPMVLMEQANIDPASVINNDRRIPAEKMQRLLRLSIEETGEEAFGLLAAEQVQPALLQGLGLAVLASDTIYAALQRLVRFSQVLSTGVRLQLEERGEFVDLYFHSYEGAQQQGSGHYAFDFGMGLVLLMCRLTLGEYMSPVDIQTTRPAPADPDRFVSLLGSRVSFGADCDRISFVRNDIVDQLITASPELARVNDEQVEIYLASFLDTSTSHDVVEIIVSALPDGAPSQKNVAASLNMSNRTLQRKLKDEGTSFVELLRGARCQLAKRYLSQANRSVVEISYLLGFSEPSTFSRAFKHWTGSAPADFREKALHS